MLAAVGRERVARLSHEFGVPESGGQRVLHTGRVQRETAYASAAALIQTLTARDGVALDGA
jgi:hypothetical protein